MNTFIEEFEHVKNKDIEYKKYKNLITGEIYIDYIKLPKFIGFSKDFFNNA